MSLRRLRVGPATLVAAAFIGPGTVTTATLAGARYGYTLAWALGFSVLATIVLQEMSARLGIAGGLGLGEALRRRFSRGPARGLTAALVIGAILVGNAAYEAGNLLGGGLGMAELVGLPPRAAGPLLGAAAFALLWTGRYRLVERVLVGLVAVMGVGFLATAVALGPDLGELGAGLLGALSGSDLLVVLGLVGTTVVPYNLFLHASAVRERWGPDDLGVARGDTVVSVGAGGVISLAVLVSAAALPAAAEVVDAGDMARALEPLLGGWARDLFAVGLMAAGLSSAITAPLAAAYATCGVMGWPSTLASARARGVWGGVLGAGVVLSAAAVRPVPAILFAQVANGLLLPIVAAFLLYLVNDRDLLGDRANGPLSNVLGALMVLVATALGVTWLARALGGL